MLDKIINMLTVNDKSSYKHKYTVRLCMDMCIYCIYIDLSIYIHSIYAF